MYDGSRSNNGNSHYGASISSRSRGDKLKLIGMAIFCIVVATWKVNQECKLETTTELEASNVRSSSNGMNTAKDNSGEGSDGSDTTKSNDTVADIKPIKSILLIGERHSGTNWITDYLKECFDYEGVEVLERYNDFKHWFQKDDLNVVPENSAVVIALFRDPYDWVEAMRVEPHQSHEHLDWSKEYQPYWYEKYDHDKVWSEMASPLPWKQFVTQPWIGRRGYSGHLKGLGPYMYEYKDDGSERGYNSILDLRRDKIMNHLSVADFGGARAFFPFRFEDLNVNGTSILLKSVEEASGLKAKCKATLNKANKQHSQPSPKVITHHKELDPNFIDWMNNFVDWKVESRIGYSRRNQDMANENNDIVAATPVKPKPTKPVEKIILIGERHSGTNWITDYLKECFNYDGITVNDEYRRFKHWFQEDDLKVVPENSAVVIALFRDPYDWVEAMRVEPHHSPDHLDWQKAYHPWYETYDNSTWWHQMASPLPWKEFVTQPWIGRRGPVDKKISDNLDPKETVESASCMNRYRFVDAAPCKMDDSPQVKGLGNYMYDNKFDGSERGFDSIIDLRRDKILNHLSMAGFDGTRAFFPFRFEDLNVNGTVALLNSVEEATGLKAKCNATTGKADHRRRLGPKAITHHKELDPNFIDWMNRYLDWEVETRIGYSRRNQNA